MNKLIGIADCTGMLASALSLLHCLAMPLVLFMYPILEFGQQEESLHQIMAAIVTVLVLAALIPGFVAHRKWPVLALGIFGWLSFLFAVLLVGPRYGETAEIVVAAAGGLILFAAHASNRRYCVRCETKARVAKSFARKCNLVAF